jgi:hypothetical protein
MAHAVTVHDDVARPWTSYIRRGGTHMNPWCAAVGLHLWSTAYPP